jgi:beta-glucosidase
MPPFRMVIQNAKPLAVMPSYNEIDGIPSHNNSWLLKQVLRKEWGFQGLTVSDYAGINELLDKHFVAKDSIDAALKAFNSGVQCEFQRGTFYKYLPDLIRKGKVKMADIDTAVYRVLHLKFQLGLFENPYVDLDNAIRVSKDPHSRELALKAAQESIVLLKNQDNFLPLSKDKYQKIAVIGPGANHVFLGGYSGEPYQTVSIVDGIKKKVGERAQVLFAQGCKLVNNVHISHKNWSDDAIEFTSHEENQKLIEEAVSVAKQSELIVLVLGETEQLCREAWSKEHIGDSETLNLFGDQDELVKAIEATGKPVIVYLMNGRPLSVNYIAKKLPVLIEGWYMGQETGTAVADVLFGDVNPSGKLTITIPRSAGQLPMYYNHKPSAQFQNYVSQESTPLFPFGYGLSYTNFSYKNLRLSAEKIKADGSTVASVEVTNSGKMKGDEIVQFYIRDKVSSVTRPVLELKGFQRISLEPGESKLVKFPINKETLAFWNSEMKYVVEPGEFEIMIGRSSAELSKAVLTVE